MLQDVRQRLPATLELVLRAGLLSVALGIPIGVYTAVKRRGVADKVLFGYGMLAGSIPDFWLGLILIFVFFFEARHRCRARSVSSTRSCQHPAPVTGMIVVDALIAGEWEAFRSALWHLVLPVATLTAGLHDADHQEHALGGRGDAGLGLRRARAARSVCRAGHCSATRCATRCRRWSP